MPLVRSLPFADQVTEWLYQPLESATRLGVTELTVGAVPSYLNVALVPEPVLPALSVHVRVTVVLAVSGPEYAID